MKVTYLALLVLITYIHVFAGTNITIDLFRGTQEVPLYVNGRTYYEILGVSPNAKSQEIAKAFAHHSIRSPKDAPYGTAFDVLANPSNRKKYDQALRETAKQ